MIKLIEEAKSIILDADDTTADFFTAFLDYYNARFGTSFGIKDFWTRKFHLVLGGTGEEAKKVIDEFHRSPYFRRILPIKGSVEGATRLVRKGKKLYVATARADDVMKETEEFYETYFRGMISDIIHSSNSHTGRVNSGRSKWEISRDLKAPMIDDDLEYTIPCSQLGFGGILFGNYGWQTNVPSGIPRAKSWEDI